MNKFFTFKPNCFSGRFFFYFGDVTDWKLVKDWYCSHDLEDKNNRIEIALGKDGFYEYDGMVIDPSPAHPLLVMRSIPHSPHEIGNLVHEIHHAVQRWTFDLDIYTSRDSEEIFAYVEGNLVEAVLELLWHNVEQQGIEGVY